MLFQEVDSIAEVMFMLNRLLLLVAWAYLIGFPLYILLTQGLEGLVKLLIWVVLGWFWASFVDMFVGRE